MKRVAQKTNVHCGPAVLEMLASYVGYYLDQDDIVRSVGLTSKIYDYGMTVTDMAKCVSILLPNLAFWYKQNANLMDLSGIVNEYHFPVGVEWQGVFYEDEDEDNGHYGVVTHVDLEGGVITLSDPYDRFAGHDRKFPISEFESRWWDENEIVEELTNNSRLSREDRMMFIITPYESSFPELLGMVKG